MSYSGAWEKLIREKTRSKISRDTVPLRQFKENETWIQLGQESPLMNKKGLKRSTMSVPLLIIKTIIRHTSLPLN